MPDDEIEQLDLRLRDLARRVIHAEKAAQTAAVEDRHGDLTVDALRLQDVILARHHIARILELGDEGHILAREPCQILYLRRNALRAPLKGVGIDILLRVDAVKKEHSVRAHRLADQAQQAVDLAFHFLFAVRPVDPRELTEHRAGILGVQPLLPALMSRFVFLYRHAAYLLCSAGSSSWVSLRDLIYYIMAARRCKYSFAAVKLQPGCAAALLPYIMKAPAPSGTISSPLYSTGHWRPVWSMVHSHVSNILEIGTIS